MGSGVGALEKGAEHEREMGGLWRRERGGGGSDKGVRNAVTSQSLPMTALGNMTPQIWGPWEVQRRLFCGLIATAAAAVTVREFGNASVAQARLQKKKKKKTLCHSVPLYRRREAGTREIHTP